MAEVNNFLWLAINRVSFLRPKEKLILAEMLTSEVALNALSKRNLEMLIGRKIRAAWQQDNYLALAESDIKYLTKRNISCTFYFSKDYPPQLKEIYDPPLVLFYRGMLPLWTKPLVAVVGTRKATGEALNKAFTLGLRLAERGVGVVSGLARGVDVTAHKGCVQVKGRAIAIMGNGIDMIYPSSSRNTARKILEGEGVLMSEYPPGTLPLKYNFPARNRIISGLCRSVVVVQAPKKSGALITADYALEQGRDLYIHECGLRDKVSEGTMLLHKQGAKVIKYAEDIFQDWGYYITEDKQQRTEQKAINSGDQLANLLKLEIEEKVGIHNGEYYWRG